ARRAAPPRRCGRAGHGRAAGARRARPHRPRLRLDEPDGLRFRRSGGVWGLGSGVWGRFFDTETMSGLLSHWMQGLPVPTEPNACGLAAGAPPTTLRCRAVDATLACIAPHGLAKPTDHHAPHEARRARPRP